ncbi:MAG: hypothetical protein ACJAQ9_001408 [Ilumatobacter sp.]|jgi:hypothetical protein
MDGDSTLPQARFDSSNRCVFGCDCVAGAVVIDENSAFRWVAEIAAIVVDGIRGAIGPIDCDG